MRLCRHDLGPLLAIAGDGDLLETKLLQGITQQQAAGDLIIDDQNFDFFR
jgi:hypothetical protein